MIALLLAAQVTVTGTVQYEDRDYTGSGFTGGTTARPIRAAEIEILRTSDGALLGSGVTDPGTGAFSIPGIPTGETVQARVYARRAGAGINAVVRNNASANAVYAALTPSITAPATSFGTVLFTIAGGAAPAFNIFDAAVKSFQYQATVDLDLPALPPLLAIYWQAGTSTGTFFSRPLNAIFLLGTSADPDEYDDDIVLHEIGHWVAYNFSKDDTLGGPHSVVDQLDPRTSWSEGWAHYWSAAVRRFFGAEYPSPNLQVDNFGGPSNSVFDLEGPSFPALAVMATNELAVAAALWDITDPANEAFDLLAGNEIETWQAIDDRIPAMSTITLEDFRAGLALEAPGIMAAVTGGEIAPGIMKDRRIRYYLDGSEANDGFASATPLSLGPLGLPLRTVFGTGDQDWYAVTLIPGTFLGETLNPGDGAVPRLELYAPDGVTLLASGSSPLQVSIGAGGTYFLRVTNASLVVENGYYDVRAQILLNVPPVIASLSASATGAPAPLRVTLTGSASDFENAYLEYQWDFEGDGRIDWASLRGPTVTRTYAKPGVYNATLRVIDGGAASASASVVISVLPSAAPTISFQPDLTAGAAPLPVTFSTAVSGVVPASYAYDFDGDGVPDTLALSGSPVPFSYRAPGAYAPRVTVTDTFHRAYEVFGPPVTASGAPPAASLAASGGNIPYAATFTAAYGAASRVEYDVDGDRRYDLDPAPAVSPVSWEIQRAGNFTAKVRVTDPSGVAGTATAPFTATAIGTRGWLVSPRAGDIVAGTSLTLTAEATPHGAAKKVQFQYRADSPPGAWTDIGGPIVSTGTLFAAPWDVSSLAAVPVDLRILIDDVTSSGDDANTVLPDSAAPTIAESGGTLDSSIPPSRARVFRNGAGVWVFSSSPLRLESVARPMANGSALGSAPVGGAWRITGGSRVRLPAPGDVSTLDVHLYDEAAGVWTRAIDSRAGHDDGWVEAEMIGPGIYALFALPAGSGGGGRFCGLAAARDPGPWIVVLALGILACCRRR